MARKQKKKVQIIKAVKSKIVIDKKMQEEREPFKKSLGNRGNLTISYAPKISRDFRGNERKPEKTERKLSKEEKQALIVIGFMVLALIGFVVFFLVFKNAGAFVYNGIKFKKTNYNGLIFYHGKIGMTTSAGVFNYNLYLRNDPRVLKNIPVNISLALRRKGYLSFQPEINNCYGSNLATYGIASFLSALGMKVEGATTSHEVAIDEGIPEKDCADAVNQTVIVLQKANETSIQQRGDCYIMDIANCRVIEATEAFILAIVKELWQIKAA